MRTATDWRTVQRSERRLAAVLGAETVKARYVTARILLSSVYRVVAYIFMCEDFKRSLDVYGWRYYTWMHNDLK